MNTPDLTIRKYSTLTQSTSPKPFDIALIGYPGEGLQPNTETQQDTNQFNDLYYKLGEIDEIKPPLIKLDTIKESQLIKEGIPINTYLKGFPNTCQLSYKIFKTEARLVRSILENSGFFYTDSHSWNILWSGSMPPDYLYENLNPYQKINHYPGSNELTRKDKMCMNMKSMADKYGKHNFGFIPETFVLPEEFSEFYSVFLASKGALWIVKPSGSSQGRGIFLLENIHDVPLDESCIISRYIKDPYLINGLKFDLRIYVLVTSIQPLRLYVYKEGLTRFASEKYVNNMTENRFVHLTNYSVNKKNLKFVQNTDAKCDGIGHKWSLKALMKYLAEQGVNTDAVWTNIYDIIIKSVLGIEGHIIDGVKRLGVNYSNCFDLYGFDILLDSSLKPWLLEVNLSPSLATDSPLDFFIKSNLITDALNLVGIYMKLPRKSSFKTAKTTIKAKNSPYLPNKIEKTQFTKQKILRILRDTLEEFHRRGNFICIYPCRGSEKYESFLEGSRTLNRIMHSFLFDKKFEIFGIGSKIRKVTPKVNLQKSFELQVNAKAFTNKVVVNGDDVLQEYMNRCKRWMKIGNDLIYPEVLRNRLDKFFCHYSWKTADAGEKSMFKKFSSRVQELSLRKVERQSKNMIRSGTSQFPNSALSDYHDEEISSMLQSCNKEISHDLVTILTEGEGILSMLSRFTRLKDIKRTKSPFIEREKRIHSQQQRPKTSNKLKHVI